MELQMDSGKEAFPTTGLHKLGMNEAVAFFSAFSRFEYALKRAGYLRNEDIAEADWDKFAGSLGAPFLEEIRASKCADEMLARPPGKPIRNGNHIQWRDAPPVTNVQSLFIGVRQARNNLFHGEKFIGEGYKGSRDRRLLTESLTILELALGKCKKTRSAFAGW
jgi:hypothetical protein